ncbi:MAG: LCP family protein [Acidimicrobiales bacterium]|nr:LCP family protein [Acidimicrobiales bacterium]
MNRLDGAQALAYVRSRYYQELHDGKWVYVGNADLGRVERQRTFLSALMGKIGDTKNPFTLLAVGSAVADGGGFKFDDQLTYFKALGVAWQFRSFHPESETVPTTPATRGGAAVLDLAPNASGVLARYR